MLRNLTENALAQRIELGKLANKAAGAASFVDYQSRKADNTLRRHAADLALFGEYLQELGTGAGDLFADPAAWEGITWGLVAAFQKWMLKEGYAVSSVNARISTIKVYAKLATKAGVLDVGEYALIKAIEGYSKTEGKRIDERRQVARRSTKAGEYRKDGQQAANSKKAQPVAIKHPERLKEQPKHPQGLRDRVIFCLLLDHGLRVSELVQLQIEDIDLFTGHLQFYRAKVDKQQKHKLTNDTWEALQDYITVLADNKGALLRVSVRGGGLTDKAMSKRAINKRVGFLGDRVGLAGLSPHDCRHYWATQAAKSGTNITDLKEAGGWSSLAMPARYIQAAAVANEGVKLG